MSAKTENRNYPTRMHEVLGVETGEVFTVMWNDTKKDFSLDGFGVPEDIETEDIGGIRYPASGLEVVYMVNHPERIIRKPRLSEEQVKKLHAALLLGFKWLTVNSVDELWLFGTKPRKFSLGWGESVAVVARIESEDNSDLSSLVSWSDPTPLDIVQVLRQNGIEVEVEK